MYKALRLSICIQCISLLLQLGESGGVVQRFPPKKKKKKKKGLSELVNFLNMVPFVFVPYFFVFFTFLLLLLVKFRIAIKNLGIHFLLLLFEGVISRPMS